MDHKAETTQSIWSTSTSSASLPASGLRLGLPADIPADVQSLLEVMLSVAKGMVETIAPLGRLTAAPPAAAPPSQARAPRTCQAVCLEARQAH